MVNFLRKAPSPASLQRDLADIRERRAKRIKELDDFKAAAISRQKALDEVLINDGAEDAVVKAEASLADAERRVRNLTSAVRMLDTQITEREAEAAELARRKQAEEAAAAVKADLAAFNSKVTTFLQAARDLAPAAGRMGLTNWTAREVEGLVRSLCAEVPIAVQRVEHEALNHIDGLLNGTVRPKLAVPEVIPPMPEPIPTRTVFLLAPVRWRDGKRIEERNRHQKLNLPVAEAEVALLKGYAVEPNDVRAKSTGAGYVVIPGGAAYADLNDPDLATAQPVYGARDVAAVKGNVRVVLGGGN